MNTQISAKVADVSSDVLCGLAADLEQASGLDASMDALHGAVRKLGFDMVDYAYVPVCRLRDGRWAPPLLEKRNFPLGWDRKWGRYCTNDPYYHACVQERALWVDWTEVQRRPNLNSSERDCLAFLGDQQMHVGLTIPIRLPAGQLAFVSAIGGHPRRQDGHFDEQLSRSLFVAAHYFHNVAAGRRLRPESQGAAILSQREIECLCWAARGKTAEATGQIIGRSVETVRVHLKHAITKLGAANCAHAVAKAALLGLIEP